MNTTGWLRGLQVTAGGTGAVSHAGIALIRGGGRQDGPDRRVIEGTGLRAAAGA